tara:strand:- start:49 stop:546 length:498 start_codon:yes stop_codon:yes gene_type:complete
MIIDATFWVAVSFVLFAGLLIYFKVPQRVIEILNLQINKIKDELNNAEKLKDEAKVLLDKYEKKLGNSKIEIKKMIDEANNEAEKIIIQTNETFQVAMDNRKKNADQKILQMKDQAIKDIKNASVKIAVQSVEKLLKNSLDKNKLDKLYLSSIEETKLALKKKSV